MSQYRNTIQRGAMVREKRKFLRFWVWSFNRSEEDQLNRMKNQLVKHNDEVRRLRRQVAKKQIVIDDAKKVLNSQGGTSPVTHGPWSFATRPVTLIEDLKKRKKLPLAQRKKGPNEGVIARLMTAK